jgi:hypothetical protein
MRNYMVKYKHTVIYWIKGLSSSQFESDQEIILNPTVDCQFILTSNPDIYCFEGDRSRAIAGLLLSGMFGKANSDTFDVSLKKALEEIKNLENKSLGREFISFFYGMEVSMFFHHLMKKN